MPTSLLFCRRLPLPSLLLPIFFCNQSKVGEAFLQKEVAGNEFKMLMPPFLHFFLLPATLLSTRRRPTMSSSLANGIWRKSAYILILKCCLPAKALQQLAIINNACFCSSIVHRDDVMFKQQSNINLLFLFDAPSHLILFLNWDNASALKFEQCHLCLFLLHQSTRGIVCFFRE